MAVDNISVAPWKLKYNPVGNGPHAVLVRLIDLFRYKDSNGVWKPWGELGDEEGLRLPHDIIVYNTSLYEASGIYKPITSNLLSDSQKYGIYLSAATYDLRKPQTFYTGYNSTWYRSFYTGGGFTSGFYYSSPDAILPPGEADYADSTITYTPSGSIGTNEQYKSTLAVGTSNTQGTFASLYVLEPDNTITANIPLSPLAAYTKVKLSTDYSRDEIKKIVKFFTKWNIDTENNTAITPDETGIDFTDPLVNPRLLYTYVWLRASFFADYVAPESFNQNLTPNSHVQHKNLIVGEGDFNRYSRADNNHKIDRQKVVMTITTKYTSASIGALVIDGSIISLGGADNIETQIDTIVAGVYDNWYAKKTNSSTVTFISKVLGYENTLAIVSPGGGFVYTTVRTWEQENSYTPITPPRIDLTSTAIPGLFLIPTYSDDNKTTVQSPYGWYNTDLSPPTTRGDVVVPIEGNFYTSGRVFSPTIDELWVYLKKVVDGRPSDADNNYSLSKDPQLASGPQASTSSKTIDQDTRLDPELAISLPSSKNGDPISTDGTSYLNASGGIKYSLNTSIKYIADRVTGSTDNNTYNLTIANSAYSPFSIHSDINELLSAHGTRIDPSSVITSGDWGPRAKPYSLRELEAQIKNLQYNQEVFANFIMANKSSTGNTSLNDTNIQGTLYQLHKSYNPNLDNVEGASPASKWLSYESTTRPTLETASTYGNSLPGSETDYNRLEHIPQQDVYLSAEGEWRYLFDHVRIPVLAETY